MRKRLHDPMGISVESLGSFSNESREEQRHPDPRMLEEQNTHPQATKGVEERDLQMHGRELEFNKVVRFGERLRRQATP